MSSRCCLLGLLAATACSSMDGGETITPLVTPTTAQLHFTMQDFDSNQVDYTLDVQAKSLTGFRIELGTNGEFCRHHVDAAATFANTAVLAAIETSELSTLTGDACERVAAGCGGPDTFLGVEVDGGARYTTQPSMCQTLLAEATLEASLESAFASLEPIAERVEWRTDHWVATGPCE